MNSRNKQELNSIVNQLEEIKQRLSAITEKEFENLIDNVINDENFEQNMRLLFIATGINSSVDNIESCISNINTALKY